MKSLDPRSFFLPLNHSAHGNLNHDLWIIVFNLVVTFVCNSLVLEVCVKLPH